MPRGHGHGRGCGPRGWRGALRGGGFRITLPRREIISVLASAKGHLSAEDIYMQAHKKYPAIGLTTVYRTLELLAQMGFAQKLTFGDGRARFELINEPKDQAGHCHLVCSVCGAIIDCTQAGTESKDALDQIGERLSGKHQFKITNRQVTFFGLCGNCQ